MRWWLVGAAALVVFMATLDTSVVAVALPALERDLGVPTAAVEWVVLGYLLPLVALTLPAGRWLDRVGRRPALVAAVGGFTVASVAAGAAPSLPVLVAARAAQGAFAGVLFALVPMVVLAAGPPERAGRASAAVMTFGPLGAVSGPVLGGWMVQEWGWPWIFYVNVPAGLGVIAVALRELPAGERLRPPDRGLLGETVLLGAATGALLTGFSLAAGRGIGWLALTPAAVPFVLVWRRTAAARPVRTLLASRQVAGPVTAVLLAAVTLSLVEFLAPYYLQRVLGVSAGAAGTAVLALPVGIVLGGPVGGVLADRWGGGAAGRVRVALCDCV
ncbi:MFS transporter, partial [Spirillospora sp. NPDC049652]